MLALRTPLLRLSNSFPRAFLVAFPRCFSTSSTPTAPNVQSIYKGNHEATANMTFLDTYSEVTLDHNNVKELFGRYVAASNNEEKATLVNTIIHELAVHSEAEEVSVYNVLEAKGLTSESKICRDEHEELEKVLWSADWTKVTDPEFDGKFKHAIKLFIQHSDREEEDVLKKLASQLSPEENDKIARDFLAKRKIVPTRPHPAAPQNGGVVQKVLGLQTKVHDKIIETLQGRDFAPLKYQHESGLVEPIKIDQATFNRA